VDARVLDLDGDISAGLEDGAMDLTERCGREGRRLE
jgi:hypothetical protein